MKRRTFISEAAIAGAVAATITSADANTNTGRRLRIGILGVKPSFISHSWSDLIEPDKLPNDPKRGNFGTSFLNMDITHVWDVNPTNAKNFANRMGAETVKNYDGMAGKVDGLIIGGINEVPWQHRLVRPYLEARTPVYLSRPFAFSLRSIDDVLNLAAKTGTPIMATSKHEHYNEIPALKAKLPNVGVINCVHATCWAKDYHMHFHTLFALPKIFGFDMKEISLITDGIVKNTYLQATVRFSADSHDFLCALQGAPNQDSFTITVVGTTGTETVRMERSPDWQDSLLFRYAPQVIAMQRTFEGKQLEPLDNIRKKTELWLTGCYSHLEKGGAPVALGTLQPDWHPPYPDPKWIDESILMNEKPGY